MRQKLCVIDAPNLQIGEFEKRMVMKQLTRFENKVVECECYEEKHTSIFTGELQNLKFESLNNWNPV